MVNGSSGVVINISNNEAYVLTAYHVISGFYADKESLEETIPLTILNAYKNGKHIVIEYVVYDGVVVKLDEYSDLALLKISITDYPLKIYADIATEEPALGEDVIIVSNPNTNYRTITKGVVSNKQRVVSRNIVWQISGGIIFGASGGAAFNSNGEVIAIARSVDVYPLRGTNNYMAAIPYIGYFVPLSDIKEFLLDSEVNNKFRYLE